MAKKPFLFPCCLFWLLQSQLIVVVRFLYSSPVSSQCLEHQKSLLLQLKHELSFDLQPMESELSYLSETYSKPLSWKPSTDCCLWEGINCDETGYVIGLDLSESYINGGIDSSSSLFNFLKLQNLNLAYNYFYPSPYPAAISQLLSLTHLNLSHSGFVGPIPLQISLLNNLVSVDLSAYSFSDVGFNKDLELEMLVKNLTQLRVLHLDGVNISLYDTKWCQVLSQTLPNLRQLSLSGCELTGELHPSLLQLKSLTHLSLSQNDFYQSVPDFLTGFSSLISLDLANNRFYGTFPRKIFFIPTLQLLDVSGNNNLTGTLPEFVPNSSLRVIRLSGTRFSGKLPDSILNLIFLEELHLFRCRFFGSVPSSFETLSELRYLDFQRNNFSGSIPSLPKKITMILFSDNHFTGVIPASYAHELDGVEVLDLSNNSLSGTIPFELFTKPSIYMLLLNRNNFTGQLKVSYNASYSRMGKIDLSENQLEGPIPSYLSYTFFSFAYFISLSHNNFWGEIPLVLCDKPFLKVLDLSNNNFNGTIPSCLGRDLTVLKLRNNKLSGTFMPIYEGECSLRTIDINQNYLEGSLPTSLTRCRDLEVLDAGNNHFHDLFPFWLGDLQRLRVLILRSNNFSGNLYHSYDRNAFQVLQIIDLSSNNFTGKIPSRLFKSWKKMMNSMMGPRTSQVLGYGYATTWYYQDSITLTFKGLTMQVEKILTVFTCVDLSNNHFEGQIPKILGDLISVQVLNLSNNHLTGRIPSAIGELKELESMDLSNNKLSGKIPQEFVKLTFLGTLNISHNLLVGEIPVGGQLDTFNATSFEGNNGLCGRPLSACPDKLPPFRPNSDTQKRSSKSFFGLDMHAMWIGFGLGGGFGINVGAIVGCIVAKHILRRRGRRFR